MIPLYILGLLIRHGPMHGYQIKKLIEEQLADFTRIKLPVIYYHLERMEASGFVSSKTANTGERPGKKVYRAGKKGAAEFQTLLRRELDMEYRPVFDADAVFYFSDCLDKKEILDGLEGHLKRLKQSLKRVNEHRSFTLPRLPDGMKAFAEIIFDHHTAHYRAEIAWAERSIKLFDN